MARRMGLKPWLNIDSKSLFTPKYLVPSRSGPTIPAKRGPLWNRQLHPTKFHCDAQLNSPHGDKLPYLHFRPKQVPPRAGLPVAHDGSLQFDAIVRL